MDPDNDVRTTKRDPRNSLGLSKLQSYVYFQGHSDGGGGISGIYTFPKSVQANLSLKSKAVARWAKYS